MSRKRTALVIVSLLAVLVACAPPTPQVIEKEVVVEKPVIETVVVEKQVVVEKPAPVSMVYITAGDVNMLALGQNVLAPEFHAMYPNVTVSVVHTGPGDAGSRLIFEKLKADKDAGRAQGDVDVAMVHQKFMAWAMAENLLLKYADELETWKYMTAADARNALGTNIEGYAMPMFHSQIAIAYNPDLVPDPPRSYEELVEWVKANPGKFGHNGIKGGMSGVGFSIGWIYWKSGNYEKYAVSGPFDEAEVATWEAGLKEMKDFNQYVTITAGNVGTLDALNRGELWMGPVWVDMFYTFMLEGKMDPKMRLTMLEPGMPGQPMYFVIPKNARNPEWAKKWVEYVTSPEVQGKIIIERYNWYPGIDGKFVEGIAPPEAFDRLYKDISPEVLSTYGKSFPLIEYNDAMLEAYEKWVIGG